MSTPTIMLLIKVCLSLAAVGGLLYSVWKVALVVWDDVFVRRQRADVHRHHEDIHQTRLTAMRWEAAGKQFRQLTTPPDSLGSWVMQMSPDGCIDIKQLNTPAERLLVAGRGVRQPDVVMDGAPEPEVLLPTLVTPEQLLTEREYTYKRLVLGMGKDGPLVVDMATLVHGAIGGSSGWGKSQLLRWLVFQLLMSADPVNVALIDVEDVTLAPFEKSDRVLWPVATDKYMVMGMIDAIKTELDQRKKAFAKFRDQGVDSLFRYNKLVEPDQRFVPWVLVVDEAATLMLDKSVQQAIRELVWRSRKYGIWNLWAAQVWYADTIPSGTSTMFGTAIHFHAEKASQGRVLGLPEAAQIDQVGRALVRVPGKTTIEIQAPLVSEGWLRRTRGTGPRFDRESLLDGVDYQVESDDEYHAGPYKGELVTGQIEKVLQLHREGKSTSAIAAAVWHSNTTYIQRVRSILEDHGLSEN